MSEANWYIVNAYTGSEEEAVASLMKRSKQLNALDEFEEVKLPKEDGEKLYKGYIFLKMELNGKTRSVLDKTPNIYGFAHPENEPRVVPEEKVRDITQNSQFNKSKKNTLEEGEKVEITGGSFEGMEAEIESIDEESERIDVLVDIFGRQTTTTLSLDEVEAK